MKRQGRVCLILLGCSLLGFALTVSLLSPRGSDAAAAGCVELLRDAGFEAGGQGWVQYSAQGYELISDFNPRTGRLGAYLAGVNNADDRISQQVALPPTTTALTLDAWWYLATAETAGVFDTMTVSLLRTDGAVLATLVTVNNTAPVGVWDELVFDLTSYAGQTVGIQFEAHTDANNISDFYLDDVSLVSCAADVTPTPTATPTQTPRHADSHDPHTDGHRNIYQQPDGDRDRNADSYRHTLVHRVAVPHGHGYANLHADGHTDPHTDGHRNIHRQSDGDRDKNADS